MEVPLPAASCACGSVDTFSRKTVTVPSFDVDGEDDGGVDGDGDEDGNLSEDGDGGDTGVYDGLCCTSIRCPIGFTPIDLAE